MQGWGHGSGPRGITLSILKSKPPECVPHVLLESSQELSKYIWDEKDDRLKGARTENLKLSVFQPNLEEGALAYLIDDDDHLQMTIHLASMYGKFYDDEEDHGSTAMFEKSLEAMQAYHETGSEPAIDTACIPFFFPRIPTMALARAIVEVRQVMRRFGLLKELF